MDMDRECDCCGAEATVRINGTPYCRDCRDELEELFREDPLPDDDWTEEPIAQNARVLFLPTV